MEWKELQSLHRRLKTGEYDGNDIMHAWIVIEEMMKIRESEAKIIESLERNSCFIREDK